MPKSSQSLSIPQDASLVPIGDQTDADGEHYRLPFTVDSALLRELGERLVGQPHIALAELIKNSYDADASLVHIDFQDDEIVVADNGQGMDFETFEGRWMRIGSPHKATEQVSRRLKRPLTGSKGVGRLAAQFLADELRLVTVPERKREQVDASINWERAIQTGELTRATAEVVRRDRAARFPGGSAHGTRVVMRGLKQPWGPEDLQSLAAELWPLQPPFRSRRRDVEAFQVVLNTPDPHAQARFDFQMQAVLDLWSARIVGQLDGGDLTIAVMFADSDEAHPLQLDDEPVHLAACDFEVRAFALRHRQPYGIPVEEAREYLRRFGGVHVYDAGFHLPYYGVETDWLDIEQDHSHRLSISRLLPESLQVQRGLNYLPTNSRLYGVVNVNTAAEHREGKAQGVADTDLLTIQISRDRLVANAAYRELKRVVRSAIDYYAVLEAQRAQRRVFEVVDLPAPVRVQRIEEVLDVHRDAIPDPVFEQLDREISQAVEAIEIEADAAASQAGLLGALATAGIGAVAYQHEFARHLSTLDELAQQLTRASAQSDLQAVRELADEIQAAVQEARASRDLFAYLLDDEDRESIERYRARPVLDGVARQLRYFLRGVSVRHDRVNEELRMPPGRLADWSALFQNVYTNAVNAMLDSDTRIIAVSDAADRRRVHIIVHDTGTGVDLDTSAELFEPFARHMKISHERRALGVGGTGLGLTIVRMLASNLRCDVGFVDPEPPFSTAFRLSWSRP